MFLFRPSANVVGTTSWSYIRVIVVVVVQDSPPGSPALSWDRPPWPGPAHPGQDPTPPSGLEPKIFHFTSLLARPTDFVTTQIYTGNFIQV